MADKYEQYSQEELIRLLRERDRKPRFGLVWERDEIDHDNTLNDDFVVLDVDPSLSCGDAPWKNLIIEGDNFDALRYLRMTHASKVRCIYIDPPYNTGNKDFIYNDRFVDKDDVYKHSKWLEFLYRRLLIARDLLSENGVIFVSIGEDEMANLALLMDQVFPGMKVASFVWKTRAGAQIAKDYYVSKDHEYVLCYANSGFSFSGTQKSLAGYANPDSDPRGDWVNYNLTKGQTYKERPRSYFPIRNPANDIWYPCNPDRVWGYSSEERVKSGQKLQAKSMEQIISECKVLWPIDDRTVTYESYAQLTAAIEAGTAPKNLRTGLPDIEFFVGKKIGYGTPRYKQHKSELRRLQKPLSTWITPRTDVEKETGDSEQVHAMASGFTSDGTALLRRILGENDFPYPKPQSLIQELIRQSTDKDDVILDFFAGSGTTGHAVLSINAEDDGERRFVLVSSSEATEDDPGKNVCRDILAPRLRAAITGYTYQTNKGQKGVEGIQGDFAYVRAKRLPTEQVFSDIQHEQVWLALQLIHFGEIAPNRPDSGIQCLCRDGEILSYVTKLSMDVIAEVQKLAAGGGRMAIYSWQPAQLRERVHAVNVSFEKIPEFLVARFGGAK
ncbi:MAG: site-specific DNA-methyltransferase [Betaproteobacteria bacterium]|nr:site-specific DNA-methyltransferase [Betaproteobacteria bacterium]